MSKIKYTIVPKENVEASIFESGVKLSQSSVVINPIVVFNSNMELGIEQEIYGDEIDPEDVMFATDEMLLNVLKEANTADMCNTIIINGFDIDLDYVREHITKLANQSDKIFSINVISDKRKYTNFTINIMSDIDTSLSEEEWEEFKQEYEESFQESLAADVEDKSEKTKMTKEEAEETVKDLLKTVLGITDDDIEEDDEDGVFTIDLNEDNFNPNFILSPIDEPKKLAAPKKTKKFKSYAYADEKGSIGIELDDDRIYIMDDETEISIPVEFVEFLQETLDKLTKK